MRRRRADQEGSSAIELALLTPVLFLIVAVTVQTAMWFHARHVALDAAREGARVARTEVDTTGACARAQWQCDAEARAKADVQQVGGQLLTDARFTAVVDGDNRGVEVQGDAVSVFGLTLKIDEKSEGPIECFRPDVGGTACAP